MMEIKIPKNMIISYPGRLFTSALLQHMKTVQIELNEIFEQTSTDVAQKSDGRHIPWFSSSVSKEFFFAPNKRFLEQYMLKPVFLKKYSNKLIFKDSSNQTVTAK